MSKERPDPNFRRGPLGEVNRNLAVCPPAYVPVDRGPDALSARNVLFATPKVENSASISPIVVYKLGERGSGTKSNVPPQDYHEIRNECLTRRVLFNDTAFPANASSLGKWENQVWKRPWEICREPKFIEDGVSRFDIKQGELGDCWFLAAIASITLNKDITRSILPLDQSFENGEYAGIFHFRFWRLGKWIDVVVDDLLPVKYNRPMFLHSESNKEFWGSLIEKAYAKLNGSYESLSGGFTYEALEDFTGGLTEVIRISEQKDKTKLFKFMRKGYERSSLMGCSMEGSDTNQTPLGLILGHAYSVTCVTEINLNNGDKVPLVRIRNPWGNEAEWKGDWCDGSWKWKDVALSEKERIGYNAESDGEFWMSMDNFVDNFTMLEVCHLSPEALKLKEDDGRRKWEVSEFRGMWVRGVSAGGCNTRDEMYCRNPQYIFTVEDPDPDDDDDETESTVIVSLMQKSRRAMGQGTENLCIGFSIYRLKNPHQLPKPLPADYFFYNAPLVTPAYAYRRGVTHREYLPPGTYCIVPTTYDPHQEGEFLLRVFSEKYNDMKENDEEYKEIEVNPKIKEKIEKNKMDDEILKKYFEDIAGTDGEVDWKGLKKMLDHVFQEELKGEDFSKDICRSMVAMMDADRSGKLDFDEFKKLCYDLSGWMEAFYMVDEDHSENLDITELKNAFSAAGFQLNKRILQMIVNRYADSDGKLDFDDFLMCSVRLKGMLATFRDKDKANQNAATFSLGEWMETTMYS